MENDVFESNVPFRIIVGWADGVSKEDAVDIARGFIQRRFDAVNSSWYVTAPFMGGYFWEVHEGGKGSSYMPAIIDALTNNPGGQHWFPSGDRVFQVMMRDGKPFGVLLQKSESKKVIESGSMPLRASGRMKRAVFKGTPVLIAGAGVLASGVLFFLSSVVMYAFLATPEPAVKDINLTKIPSAQWDKLASIKPTEIVSKIEFEQGEWKIEKRPFVIKDLVKAEPPKEPATPTTANTAAQVTPTSVPAPPSTTPSEVSVPSIATVPTPVPQPPMENQTPVGGDVPPVTVGPTSVEAPVVSAPLVTTPTPALEMPAGATAPTDKKPTVDKHETQPKVRKQKAHKPQQSLVPSDQLSNSGQTTSDEVASRSRAAEPHKQPAAAANKQVGKPLPLVPGDVK